MMVLRRETLIIALENVYGSKGLTRGDVLDLCDFVLDFFGYEDYVLDNVLSPPERDAFYDLEENGILKTQAEEVTLSKGKIWRVNQWVFRRNKILEFANIPEEEDGLEQKYEQIFKELENQEIL
jgi:hypothetical protein